MRKDLIALGKQVLSLTSRSQQHEEDIKQIRQELRAVVQALRHQQNERKRDRDNTAHERENVTLRLENLLLLSGRVLPPGEAREPSEVEEMQRQLA